MKPKRSSAGSVSPSSSGLAPWVPWAFATVVVGALTLYVWNRVRRLQEPDPPRWDFESYRLVGASVTEAQRVLEETHPDLYVVAVPEGTSVDGTRSDRVVLVYDDTHTVVRTPVIG